LPKCVAVVYRDNCDGNWYESQFVILLPVGGGSIVISVLFVCVCLCVRFYISKSTYPHFTDLLSMLLVARRSCDNVMWFSFVNDVMFSHNGANGPKSIITLCFVYLVLWWHQEVVGQHYVFYFKFTRWQHRGQSLMSMNVLLMSTGHHKC